MKKLCKSSAVAFIAAVALGLGACSADSGKDAKPNANEKVTIQYLHRLPDGEGMTKVAEIIKKWNAEHPNIQVEATKFDGKAQELIKKLETDVKAKNAPCLAQIGYGEVAETYVKGLLEDVTKEAKKYTKNFSAGPVGLMTVDNKIVGLPQDTGPLMYMYNKAEFKKLGLKVPTTAQEFIETAAKAAAAGKYIADFQPDEAPNLLSAMAGAAGDKFYGVEGDAWTVKTTGEGAKKVASFWQAMLDAKSVLTIPRWDDGFKAALNEQKLIGTIGAAWEAALLAGDMAGTANEGQWAIAQLPDLGNGAKTGPDGGSGVAVVKGCKAPAQAMEFNNWFNTQVDELATQGLVVAASGKAPATPEAQKKFYGGQDFMKDLLKANDAMVSDFSYIPGWSSVTPAMTEVAAKVVSGSAKVEDIFKAAQGASETALTDAGLKVKK